MSLLAKVRSLMGGARYDGMTLPQLVTLVADYPRAAIRDAFYRRLLVSKVGARTPESAKPYPAGTRVLTDEDDYRIPDVCLPDGSPCLAVYCDIQAMVRAFPHEQFFELDARVVLELAKENGLGVVVQNALDGRDSWACVPSDDVAVLLSAGKAEAS